MLLPSPHTAYDCFTPSAVVYHVKPCESNIQFEVTGLCYLSAYLINLIIIYLINPNNLNVWREIYHSHLSPDLLMFFISGQKVYIMAIALFLFFYSSCNVINMIWCEILIMKVQRMSCSALGRCFLKSCINFVLIRLNQMTVAILAYQITTLYSAILEDPHGHCFPEPTPNIF